MPSEPGARLRRETGLPVDQQLTEKISLLKFQSLPQAEGLSEEQEANISFATAGETEGRRPEIPKVATAAHVEGGECGDEKLHRFCCISSTLLYSVSIGQHAGLSVLLYAKRDVLDPGLDMLRTQKSCCTIRQFLRTPSASLWQLCKLSSGGGLAYKHVTENREKAWNCAKQERF